MPHLAFALIHDETIMNIVVGTYSDCDAVAKASYGTTAFAKEVTYTAVQIGDTYRDGKFTRVASDGKTYEIEEGISPEQQISKLMTDNAALREELNIVSLAVLDIAGTEE